MGIFAIFSILSKKFKKTQLIRKWKWLFPSKWGAKLANRNWPLSMGLNQGQVQSCQGQPKKINGKQKWLITSGQPAPSPQPKSLCLVASCTRHILADLSAMLTTKMANRSLPKTNKQKISICSFDWELNFQCHWHLVLYLKLGGDQKIFEKSSKNWISNRVTHIWL